MPEFPLLLGIVPRDFGGDAVGTIGASQGAHAYCLMEIHYLVVETPEANLVAGMRWIQSTDTIRLNHRKVAFFGNDEECDNHTASMDADPTDSEGREQRPRHSDP